MTVRLLSDADKDTFEAFILQHIKSSMFILGNARNAGITPNERPYSGIYVGQFSATGDLEGVAVHYWNGNIMVQSPHHERLPALLSQLSQETRFPICGVLGDDEQCDFVIRHLGLTDDQFAKNESESLFDLALVDLVCPPACDDPSYKLLPASEGDPILLEKWLRAYDIEALGGSEGAGLEKRTAESVRRTLEEPDRWIVEVDGRPVALCGFNARLPGLVQIGPVWTPPEYRGRGYAKAILALALREARDHQDVTQSILFTNNAHARRAYAALGYREIGRFRLALLNEPLSFPTL